MNTRLNDKKIRYVLVFILILLMAPAAQQSYAASMTDYCLLPPYVKTAAHPNVLIMMDNATDMGEPAYTDTYNPAKTYNGYFKPTLKYTYRSNRFVPDSNGIYSGNLLNWATTSKYDLLQNILVGGISTSRQTNINTLVSKSNAWTKTLNYTDSLGAARTCQINVNSANVEITELSVDACGYLDSPAHPIPTDPQFSLLWPFNSRLAGNAFSVPADILSQVESTHVFRESFGSELLSRLLSAVSDFLVSPAEAASPLKISGGPSTLTRPVANQCTAYSVSISAAGGTNSGYTWTISAGSLPPGLSLGASGTPETTISGTPTVSGTYNFTVQVNDDGHNTDRKDYSITVDPATVTISFTSPLPQGYAGNYYLFYTTSAAASACNSSFTWSIPSGTLPPGFSYSYWADALEIWSYNPTAGTYNFTLSVTDAGNNTVSLPVTLTINPALVGLYITPDTLTNATVGSSYTSNYFFSSCGTTGVLAPFSWSVISGSLPPGLFLAYVSSSSCPSYSSYGYFSGTPTTAGTYNFTLQFRDSSGLSSTKAYSITVDAAPKKIRTTGNLNVQVCVGNYTYNCSTSLPSSSPPTTLTDWKAAGCSESDLTQCILKSGLVDQFWSQARFGVMDFSKYQNVHSQPNMSNCIEQSPNPTPDPSFMTAVENAIAIDPSTVLVNGEYEAINYYQTNTTNNCDPFVNALKCTKSFVLILSAGVGADNPVNPDTGLRPELFSAGVPAACTSANLKNLAKNSCYGFNNADLRSDIDGRQYVSTYIVNTMGTFATSGYNPDNPPVTTGDILEQAAVKGGGVYYEVQDPAQLKDQLAQAFQDIIKRAASGTAASVLASGEGSGANLIQAVYYPRKQFGNDEIDWIGRLTNLWYYVDPNLNNSNIREDDGIFDADGAKVLTLKTDGTHHDNIVQLYFDTINEVTKAHRWEDTNGDAVIDAQLPDLNFEDIGNLWEAGGILWNRNLSTSPRSIYTQTTGTRIDFSTGNRTALSSYLQTSSDSEAEAVIRYMKGEDTPFSPAIVPAFTPAYRPRSVSINGTGPYTWKLGDVLNSTPKISSWLPLNMYHKLYNDSTYGVPGSDPSLQNAADETHYITSSNYRARGMIFTGANDGMLHAFKLGSLQLKWTGMGNYDKARLMGAELGKELWAFIPKNALPYLKYIADPAYCHVYTVDQTPFIFDASIGTPSGCTETDTSKCVRAEDSWRTILIGGMRYGGGCRKPGTCAAGSDCVNTPALDPADPSKGLGYSSYFALDITDQNNPVFLWEFANDQLGYTTAGPAVLRESVKDASNNPLPDRNGKWFVVLGSGPTGPIDPGAKQFLAHSDQPLRLFVLDLTTGATYTIEKFADGTSLPSKAFVGSLANSSMDTDLDYQDDVLYIPYVKQASDGTWGGTDGGGVLRLSTKEDVNPANWAVSKLMDGIGPVTSAVAKLQNNTSRALWTFFGTGRYYYDLNGIPDDPSNRRRIFGVKDPCFSNVTGLFVPDCIDSVGALTNVTNIANVERNPDTNTSYHGWYIDLDADYTNGNVTPVSDPTVRAERVITDPVAATSGVVFMTTFKPFSDSCSLGGTSSIWAVKYNTGGDASSLLKGQALIQVSTGSIEQLRLSDAFKDTVTGLNTGNRKSAQMQGVPPMQQGLSIIGTPPPVKRVLHIKER